MYLRFFWFVKKIGYKDLYTNNNRRFYDKHFFHLYRIMINTR